MDVDTENTVREAEKCLVTVSFRSPSLSTRDSAVMMQMVHLHKCGRLEERKLTGHFSYWPSDNGRSMTQALALGLGSMFNHSTHKQNVTWSRNLETDCITYVAHRDIQKGEELCISYGVGRLWFEDAEAERSPEWDSRHWKDDSGETLGELNLSGIDRISLD